MAKTDIEDSDWNPDDAPPSKSSKKLAMTALQVLGTRLVNLTPSQLEQIPIEDVRLRGGPSSAENHSAWWTPSATAIHW